MGVLFFQIGDRLYRGNLRNLNIYMVISIAFTT